MAPHSNILRAFRFATAASLIILTVLASASSPPSTPQSNSDDQKYAELKSSSPQELDENTLIQLAYGILFAGNVADAVRVFKLEVQEYRKYWNAYDSLGEAYMDAKQNDLAIQNYEMSVTLKPDNQNGIDMLKKLREQKQP